MFIRGTNNQQVLLPQTQKMRTEMETAVDVDGMIAVHNNYMNRIKDQCLLGPKLAPIHQTITTLLDFSIAFSDMHLAHTHARNSDQSMRDISVIVPRRRRHESDSEDSDEDNGESVDEYDEPDVQQGAYANPMVAASAKFNALLDFVRAGLRGVARAGAMPHLETLAKGLDGVGWEGRYG